jgi:PadR family transcriptional regulator AphA
MSGIPTPDETILGLLCVQPMHGYELLRHFQNRDELGAVWRLSASQLYAVLKRLSDHGLITGRQISTPSAPERTEYVLTDAGSARLQEWLHDPNPSPSVRAVRVAFLSRLIVARALDLPLDGVIAAQRATCAYRLTQLRSALEAAAGPNERLSLELVIAQTEALLGWIDRSVPKYIAEKASPV